jgi:plasmid stability protein
MVPIDGPGWSKDRRNDWFAMNEIKVRLKDEVLIKLERLAREHGHSVDEEVSEIVVASVGGERQPIDFEAEFRRLRAMTPKGVQHIPAWRLVRQDRDHDH